MTVVAAISVKVAADGDAGDGDRAGIAGKEVVVAAFDRTELAVRCRLVYTIDKLGIVAAANGSDTIVVDGEEVVVVASGKTGTVVRNRLVQRVAAFGTVAAVVDIVVVAQQVPIEVLV